MRYRYLALVAAVSTSLRAQTFDQRISDVRDGTIHLTYASRPGVCGDGKETVRSGPVIVVFPSMFGYGHSDMSVCFTGPIRVALGRSDGETVSIRVHVGGRWSGDAGSSDLGVVSAPEAARYFLREATRASGKNAEYALAAAVFADSVPLWSDLGRLARSPDVRAETRHRAVFWIGTYDDPGAGRLLHDLVSDAALDDEVRGAAIIANPRAAAWLANVATSSDESNHTREQAMFWLGQGRAPTAELVRLYDRLSEPALRTHYTFVLSQRRDREALEKLIDVAEHDANRDVRRQALFWLGQSKDPRAAQYLRELVTR